MQSVKTEFYRILGVFGILGAVALWQFDFVSGAVGANPALNLIIFGTFAFCFILILSALHALRNEYRAFYALTELHEDAERMRRQGDVDGRWRMMRCHQVGIVFKKPKILGQSYQLISEQLTRDQVLHITPSTMSTLMEGIGSRLSESRSLIGYVSGMLVMLGLIGTFIGLMVTLSSVGQILGSMDLGGGGDPIEMVSSLMTNLQTPLGGMATGFSSSLFGLVTSLAAGIMTQMLTRAGRTLKSDVGDWLSNTVELTDGREAESAGDSESQAPLVEERRLALLMRTARYVAGSAQRQNQGLRQLTDEVKLLAADRRETQRSVQDLTLSMQAISDQNHVLHLALSRTVDALHAVSSATNVRSEVAELARLMAQQADIGTQRSENQLVGVMDRFDEIEQLIGNGQTKDPEAEGLDLLNDLEAEQEDAERYTLDQLNGLLAQVYRREVNALGQSKESEGSLQKRTGSEG